MRQRLEVIEGGRTRHLRSDLVSGTIVQTLEEAHAYGSNAMGKVGLMLASHRGLSAAELDRIITDLELAARKLESLLEPEVKQRGR